MTLKIFYEKLDGTKQEKVFLESRVYAHRWSTCLVYTRMLHASTTKKLSDGL